MSNRVLILRLLLILFGVVESLFDRASGLGRLDIFQYCILEGQQDAELFVLRQSDCSTTIPKSTLDYNPTHVN